jgi:hypothetical protein
MHRNSLFILPEIQLTAVFAGVLSRNKLRGYNRMQFSFEFSSPHFSDSLGLQEILTIHCLHQVAQIVYELPYENKKNEHCLDFCSCELSSVLETGVCHSLPCLMVSGPYLKINFYHML